MSAWWQSLSDKEKNTIKIGIIITTIVLFYELIWDPLVSTNVSLREKITRAESLNASITEINHKIIALTKNSKSNTSIASLLTIMQTEVNASSFATHLSQMRQTEQGVELQFDSVEFDEFTKWLTNTIQKYHLKVTHLQLTKISTGLVRVSVQLSSRSS